MSYLDHQFYAGNGFNHSYEPLAGPSRAFQYWNATPAKTQHKKSKKSKKSQQAPDYIANAHEPSVKIDAPSALRKLLVLDLNGTLVYRSPHSRARHTSFRLRAVHLRPYMHSLREYLFHQNTLEWLDTMVWSSAQPHSVQDMVDKTFADSKDYLIAIWARDTLGLDERDYHRKTQTTKDLSKPWSWYNRPLDPEYTNGQTHSALTTLLLDDSPLKAHLQPYNHLCIREYDGTLRTTDLQALDRGRERDREREEKRKQQAVSSDDISSSPSPASSSSGSDIPGFVTSVQRGASPPPSQKKRKHSRETRSSPPPPPPLTSSSPNLDSVHPSSPPSSPLLPDHGRDRDVNLHQNDDDDGLDLGYDTTLLAVIGVLETIKWESNVAGWIRAGGLTDPVKITADEGENDRAGSDSREEGGGSPIPKRRKLSQTQPEGREDANYVDTGGDAGGDDGDDDTSNVRTDPGGLVAEALEDGKEESAATTSSDVDDVDDDTAMGDSGRWQWFHDGAATIYWAREGVKALRALGVKVDPGVL